MGAKRKKQNITKQQHGQQTRIKKKGNFSKAKILEICTFLIFAQHPD